MISSKENSVFFSFSVREHNFLRDKGLFAETEDKNMMDRAVPGRSVPYAAEILLWRGWSKW